MVLFRSVEWCIAWRYLRLSKKEGVVSVIAGFSFLGILLGVATLIIVMSVMNGFRHELVSRVIGFNGHITIHSYQGTLEHFLDLAAQIKTVPGVISAAPFIEKQALLSGGSQATGAMIRGISKQDLLNRPLIASNLLKGDIHALDHPNALIIGYKMAQRLQVQLGDRIKITSPQAKMTLMGNMPSSRHFRIAGIFDSGMHEYDSAFGFIALKDAQTFFELPGKVSGIEIFVPDPEKLSELKQYLRAHFPQYAIYDWQQANAKFFSTIEVQRNVMFLILMLIIIVAAFNIISCLVMIVKDKTKDIAIMRAFGVSRWSILKIFFFTGAFLGVSGTAVGTGLGLLFSYHIDRIRVFLESLSGVHLFQAEIYFLSHLPSRTDPREVGTVVISALLLTFLATLYPAYKACCISPCQGLRYE